MKGGGCVAMRTAHGFGTGAGVSQEDQPEFTLVRQVGNICKY